MSSALKRIVLLSLALVLAFALIGCAEGGPSQPQVAVENIVADAVTAMDKIDTCKLDMNMGMAIEVTGGEQPGKATMAAGVVGGIIDNAKKEMQMTMNMSIDVPGQAKQDMAMALYLVGEWMYMKVSSPQIGAQWMKMKQTEEMWAMQGQIAQQVEFLKTATKVELLGSENVNGTDCYVVKITPDMAAIAKWLSQQQAAGLQSIDLEKLDLAQLFKELTIKEWIAKDSYLMTKSEVGMLMEMRPGDVGATENDFSKMTIDMNVGMRFYDYNQPVSIELPPEALKAPEVPTS